MLAPASQFNALHLRASTKLNIQLSLNLDDPIHNGYLLTFDDGSVYYAITFAAAKLYIDFLDTDSLVEEHKKKIHLQAAA